MRNIRRIIGVALIMVLGLMALGATAVLAAPLAQSDDPVQVDPETETPEVETDVRTGPCGITRELMEQIIDREALQAVVADTLGMTVDELQAAKDSGQRITDLAEAQGVTLEEIQTAVQAARDEMVQQALDDELITAEQAECIMAHEGGPCLGGFGPGFGRGFRGGPRNGEGAPATTESTSLNA